MKPVSNETVEIASLILIIGSCVALFIVCPLSYWVGKRSYPVDGSGSRQTIDTAHGKDSRA